MDGLTILVVDDHDDTLRAMRKLLEVIGYRVLTALSAKEARRVAASEGFDVLVSDLQLPDGTGWNLLADLRENPLRPFGAVALSGLAFPSDLQRSKDAGFCVHLTKPCTLEQILQAIATCRAQLEHGAPPDGNRDPPAGQKSLLS